MGKGGSNPNLGNARIWRSKFDLKNFNFVAVNFVNVNENLDWQAVHNRDVSDAGIALKQTLHLWKQPLLFEFLASLKQMHF